MQFHPCKQDLLLDLIRRIPAFDSGRGALGAFAGKVIAHRVARTARVAIRERSLFGIVPTSLDEPVPDADGLTRGDLVAEGNGYGALFGQSPDRIAEVDRRLDLARGLDVLPESDRELCVLLTDAGVDELAARGVGARSSLYRRVSRVRLDLMAAGVGGA